MQIHCPYCGPRDLSEFTYLGDAAYQRPDASQPDAGERFYHAVYLRDNPRGPHVELWYHQHGCRAWLEAARDTATHEFLSVKLAMQRPAQ